MDKKAKIKGMASVVILAVAILLIVIVITIAIVGMMKESNVSTGSVNKKEDTSLYSLSNVTSATTQESQEDSSVFEESQQESAQIVIEQEVEETKMSEETVKATQPAIADDVTKSNDKTTDSPQVDEVQTKETTKKNVTEAYDPVEEYENLSKNGENQLSDHHNNKFIKLVSEKYKVDPELLVAIYSEPDKGSNFVLEFNGKKDGDGNVIKSPDTLSKVYQIDKNKNVVVATGKAEGNIGVSYAEGALCFNIVKTIVMPQYPEYFTGVEK